jgi:hypothetical protein
MWFVYRLPGVFKGWALSTPMHTFREQLAMGGDEITSPASRKIKTLMLDWTTVQTTAKQVGWDGGIVGQAHILTIPRFDRMDYGFLWKQPTLGTTFIGSPVDLVHLHEDIDWDARTDSEALSRAKGALQGQDVRAEKRAAMFARSSPWVMSRNGNPTRVIQGHQCTVFTGKRGGFAGIVFDGTEKVFTKDCQTIQEVKDYIDDNIEDLIEAVKKQ